MRRMFRTDHSSRRILCLSSSPTIRINPKLTILMQRSAVCKGRRFGAVTCAISASVVFIINFVVIIWGSVHNKSKGSVLYEGHCKQVHQLNTGLHLLLNLLSTLLLSSSNYCMQCLSAPTRKEIDETHARGTWLDIGIPSIRNLRQINPRRTVL